MLLLSRVALALAVALALPTVAFAAVPPSCKGRDLVDDPAITPNYAAFADDLVNSDGLLRKIEKEGIAPSYVYGTVHSTQSEPVALAREAAKRFDGARAVITELGGPFDAGAKVNMGAGMLAAALSADVDTFAGQFTAGDAELAERYLEAHGYPKEMAHHLKLWYLALATSMPSCESEGGQDGLPEVDETLASLGKAKGLPVIALETLDEQISTLSATPPKLAAQMLVATARTPGLDDDSYVTLLRLYREKHPARALAVLDALPGISEEDRHAERDFAKLLLVGRNGVMASRAAPYLASGGAFIAVGALHLCGKDGLVERFRDQGYRVTRVW